MKYSELIEEVRALYPNEYTDEEMLGWIDDVNTDVKLNIEKNPGPAQIAKAEGTVAVPMLFKDIYIFYILSQIAYHQKDFESYERHKQMYMEKRSGYMSYYIRTQGSDTARFTNWI